MRCSPAVRRLTLAAVLAIPLAACDRAPPPGAAAPGAAGGPPPVTVAAAIEREVQEVDEFAGRIEATQQVEVRARVNGYLESIHFEPGSDVQAGDLLFVIDPKPLQARLAEAEAAAANTQAQLDLARIELERQQQMLPDRATSKREYDAAAALVATLTAARRANQAAVDAVKVDLGYTRITSPIDGRVGKDERTIGNLVQGDAPDSPLLTTVVALDPVYATFEADESAFLKYIGAARNEALKVEVGLANEQGTPHAARLAFIDNQLDPASGTVRMRAVLPNPERLFTPGLYARVRLSDTGSPRRAVMIADRAIGTDQSKRFVLVLDAQNVAQYREVKLGRVHDGLRVIESGLEAGETIVVNGLQRVRPGSPVTPTKTDMQAAVSAPPPAAG
ncbi:MAG: efflux RND transporter periplasmic adaptor subunit [Gammaproteobacteria bacterium]|nr:efflux RND transporter periplasmic adaptor subunit [Gammaproteobacteria bacterium]